MENSFLKHFIEEPIYVIQEKDIEPDTLKVEEPVAEFSPEKSIPEFKIKGDVSRKVLVIVDYSEEEHIKGTDEAFLAKILMAVKVEMTDTTIINLNNNSSFDYDHLSEFQSSFVLYFSDQNKVLPSEFDNYHPRTIQNKQLLMSPTLSKIASDVEEKKSLWAALKQMF